jgi:hypothetical protein
MRSIRALLLLGLVALLTAALAAPVAAGGRPFATSLSGAEEVPGPGDPDGSGSAWLSINPGREEICYTIEVSGIAPATLAHIHVGDAGTAGPPVVDLMPPTSGSVTACATGVERDLALAIMRDPTHYYVNVHTSEHPAGAVRGQLGD